MDRYVRANRELWDAWTDINIHSAFYDVAGFRAAPAAQPLDTIARAGLGNVDGKSLLHLQCHFGLDTLRLALAGADVTGVDFSPKAIAYARRLAEELGIVAHFIESDLYALPDVLDATFDVVFTSWGVLSWLPDLAPWGRLVARCLRPGGTFFIAEGHPVLFLFDPTADKLDIELRYPYFATPEPIVIPVTGNYADPSAQVSGTEYAFAHSLEDIVMALLAAGLELRELREHQHIPWRAFPFMIEQAPREWTLPADRPSLPLAFSLRATKGEGRRAA
jgi:SAM-dependent methyltransferase